MWTDKPDQESEVTDQNGQYRVTKHLESLDLLGGLTQRYFDRLEEVLKNKKVGSKDPSFVDRTGESLTELLSFDPSKISNKADREKFTKEQRHYQLLLGRPNPGIEATWFIGPGGENIDALISLASGAIKKHGDCFRVNQVKVEYQGNSDGYRNWADEIQQGDEYNKGIETLRARLDYLVDVLNKGSVPFHSFSYLSHMLWDNTLPGVLGWIVGLLYNQNNVAAEASPVTTAMEIDLSRQLCRMIGFENTLPPVTLGKKENYHGRPDGRVVPWGKITCDGSVANIESIWMARNFRFFSLALHAALIDNPDLENVRIHEKAKIVPTGKDEGKPFTDLTPWQVINLVPDEFFNLLDRLARLLTPEMQSDISLGHKALHSMVDPYDFRTLGMVEFARRNPVIGNMPMVLAPGTRHYSWPKGATLLGLGSNQLKDVPVDKSGRLDIDELDILLAKLLKKKTPLFLVVSVHGSTTEGAIDPLAEIISLRKKYRKRGYDFLIHVDAAWGGYFQALNVEPDREIEDRDVGRGMNMHISEEALWRKRAVVTSLKPSLKEDFASLKYADSITLDPHKSGFIPYPAGGLLLRDSRLRERIAVRAPIVYKGESDPTVSWYGIEGSRAGAAVVSTWFSHLMIPLDRHGYGQILGRCLFNAKLFYASLHYMAMKSRDPTNPATAYFVTTVPSLPNHLPMKIIERYIERLATDDIDEIARVLNIPELDQLDSEDLAFREFISEFGPDSAIVAYAFTPAQYIGGEFIPVPDLQISNFLNNQLFDKYSMLQFRDNDERPELYLSSSSYATETHGESFVKGLKESMGVEGEGSVACLITTNMNPWLIETPTIKPRDKASPFQAGNMIGYLLGILDSGIKAKLLEIKKVPRSHHHD